MRVGGPSIRPLSIFLLSFLHLAGYAVLLLQPPDKILHMVCNMCEKGIRCGFGMGCLTQVL